jgi:hypothetical protein
MFAPALKRLVWKDARTLAGVWIALVVAVVLIQATMLWQRDLAASSDFLAYLMAAVAPMAFCFAVAAAGILFAGEAEEGTDNWLRGLPVSPWLLSGAKLGTGIAEIGCRYDRCSAADCQVAELLAAPGVADSLPAGGASFPADGA